MNKQAVKRLVSLLTALALVLGTAFVATDKVAAEEAANVPYKLEAGTVWMGSISWASVTFNDDYEYEGDADFDSDDVELISVESENEDVLTTEVYGTKRHDNDLIPHKPGESKITVTYNFKGETYSTSAVFVVKEYPWAVKKATLNGKKIKIKEGDTWGVKYNYKKDNIKVKIVPKAGWKVQWVNCTMIDKNENYKEVKITKKAIKKGTKIKFPKKYGNIWVSVELVNKKGEIFSYGIDVYRPGW